MIQNFKCFWVPFNKGSSHSTHDTPCLGDAMRGRSVDYGCSMLAITFGVIVVLCNETIHSITSGDYQSHVLFHSLLYSLEVLLMLFVLSVVSIAAVAAPLDELAGGSHVVVVVEFSPY
jgi:hypothetical protein